MLDILFVKDLKDVIDCSLFMVMKVVDQLNFLLQFLKFICLIVVNIGLIVKEVVMKVWEFGLLGLNEGGERLIVQVVKIFCSFFLFVECEECGRYFI